MISLDTLVSDYPDLSPIAYRVIPRLDKFTDKQLCRLYCQHVNRYHHYSYPMGNGSRTEVIMQLFDTLADNHGVEYSSIDYDSEDERSGEDTPEGLVFSNTGETYHPTLIYVVEVACNSSVTGYFTYASVGDIVEQYI